VPIYLQRIIEAREYELDSPMHIDMESLLSHAESTSSALNLALLSLLRLSPAEHLTHSASHIGVAHSIASLLRALPYHASKGVMVIPANVLAHNDVNLEEIFRRGPEASGIKDAVREFAAFADEQLILAREKMKRLSGSSVSVPREAMPIFLGAIPVSNFLRRLEEENFDAFTPKLQVRSNVRLPWQIWHAYFTRTF